MPIVALSVALVAASCAQAEPTKPAFTGDIAKANPPVAEETAARVSGDAPEPTPLAAADEAALKADLAATPAGCEVLSGRDCLLPFPSDAYTVADNSSSTGRRVNIPSGQLANTGGKTLDVTEWNRNDGFSPSTPILMHVPGMDLSQTKLVDERNIEMSLTPDSPTVLVNLGSGQLVPHWAEIDSHATSPNDSLVIIHPAVSLGEAGRFAVAFRNVKDSSGQPVAPPLAFKALRDNNPTDIPVLEGRRAEMDALFSKLADAGVNRADTYAAWSFTVASADSLAGRALAMRDDAFGKLNGQAPTFTVTESESRDMQPGVARVVRGTFEVPLYLTDGGAPGSRMAFDEASGKPASTGTYVANFVCSVPEKAVKDGKAVPVVYGHGLLGSADEAASSQVQHTAGANNALYCSTDWIGMSRADIDNAVKALGDLSNFPTVADRLQQSLINVLYLGRLMIRPDGLGSVRQFQTDDGKNLIDTKSAYFDGNSQGAIMGGAVTALAQDWTKASLGVGGMGYSTLLNRSVDFDQYATVLRAAYPNTLDQQIAFGLLQMLWDRGETSGYVQHLTDRPYDLTPAHKVILTVAFGDHQVANITAFNIARTLKIPVATPIMAKDRQPAGDFFWNLSPIRKFPLDGSALFVWDSGTLGPPIGNITPAMSDEYKSECASVTDPKQPPCADPHEDPRRQPAVIDQKKAFFMAEGKVEDVCHDQPCKAKPRADFDY